jgi:hypothetical protein
MDSITSALSSLGGGSTGKGLMDLAAIGSTGYGLYNNRQNQQYQNQLRSLAQSPTKMNAYAEQFTKPLTAGLQANVANNTQSYLAERGLSDSPQIAQQVQAQAIAPQVQQDQQQGYQNAIQALNVGGGAVNPNLQQANSITNLAKAFSLMNNGAAPGSLATLQNYLRTMGTMPQTTPDPYSSVPGPIDTSSLNPSMSDYSGVFPAGSPDVPLYTPDYTSSLVAAPDYSGVGAS